MDNNNRSPQFGIRRPVPHFASITKDDAVLQIAERPRGEAEVESVSLVGTSLQAASIDAYTLPVEEVLSELAKAGISKSKDSVQRYCREGTLNCMKLGMLRRYYATQDSVDALVENLLQDAVAGSDMQPHAGAPEIESSGVQLHAPSSAIDEAEIPEEIAIENELHTAAGSNPQVHSVAHSPDLEVFYREQIKIKDEQLRVKDEQIAAMLERDRETNILVRELQGLVSKTFNLIPGRQGTMDRD